MSRTSKKTEIFYAAQSGDLVKLAHILDGGFDIDTKNYYGFTALHFASERGHIKCVRFLLQRGAKIDPIDEDGNTPLHRACVYGRFRIIKLLLASGANRHISNNVDRKAIDMIPNREIFYNLLTHNI